MLLGCQGPAINYIPAARTRPPNYCSERGTGMQTQWDNVPGLQPALEGWGCEDTARQQLCSQLGGLGGCRELTALRVHPWAEASTECPAPNLPSPASALWKYLRRGRAKRAQNQPGEKPLPYSSQRASCTRFLGGKLGFFSASLKQFPQLLAGRRHLLPTSKCLGLLSSCFMTLLSSSQHSPLTCDNS